MNDRFRDFILDRRQILDRPIEVIGPHKSIARHAYQRRVDAQLTAAGQHRPLDDQIRAEAIGDSPQVSRFVRERRGDNLQS